MPGVPMPGSSITASMKSPPPRPSILSRDEEKSRSRPAGGEDGAQHGGVARTWPQDPAAPPLQGNAIARGHATGLASPVEDRDSVTGQAGDLSLFLTGLWSPRAAPDPNLGLWEELVSKAILQ